MVVEEGKGEQKDMWRLKKIHTDEAWKIFQGEGVVVAVIDTGVDYNHPDLWDNIWVDPALILSRHPEYNFENVKAKNGVGLWGNIGFSNGIRRR